MVYQIGVGIVAGYGGLFQWRPPGVGVYYSIFTKNLQQLIGQNTIRIKNKSANLQGVIKKRSKYLVSHSIYSKHLYPMRKALVLPNAEKAWFLKLWLGTGCGIMRVLVYVCSDLATGPARANKRGQKATTTAGVPKRTCSVSAKN